ncbi:MAG: hypothetical protein QM760_04585 [Nibricoccus sp.]
MTSVAQVKEPEVIVPELRRVVMLPVVVEAAAKAGVPAGGIEAGVARTGLRKGDSVTALVSHLDGGKTRQWVVFLKADPPVGADAAKAPPDLVMYSSSGRELRIHGEPGAVAIRVLGPFFDSENGAKKSKDRWSGTPVNQAYLALGLDRACDMMIRMAELGKVSPEKVPHGFGLGFGTQPFPAEKWPATRSVLDRMGVTEADENALVGSFPALSTFLQIVSQTQGLDEVLKSVVDISWVSVLKNGGRLEPNFQYLNPFVELPGATWGLPPEVKCYSFKFQLSLNGKPALNCQMAVTAPRPPLLTSAGIVGLAAQRPDGKGPLLLMQVVDARCAE